MGFLITAFDTTIGALKSAGTLAISLSKLHTMAEVQAKAIELQQVLLSAQSSAIEAQSQQFALLEDKRMLEEELTEVKAWNTEKDNYKLEAIQTGAGQGHEAFVYSYKEGMDEPKPAHKVCANCYHDRHISILQSEIRFPGRAHILTCHRCNSDIYTSGGWQPEHSGRKTTRK